jgi:acyl-CoA reductase-like NAD-dependent aldehyde dehydrogenase
VASFFLESLLDSLSVSLFRYTCSTPTMTTDIQNSISLLRASVVEGRPENVRYRQDQLYALHSALQASSDAICLAITNDAQCSPQEAQIELYLGMDALKRSYERLDFDQSLKSEYLVAFGNNNLDRRVALGLVAVRPSRHSRFNSILSPLVAAIAAGNCIILEVSMPIILPGIVYLHTLA